MLETFIACRGFTNVQKYVSTLRKLTHNAGAYFTIVMKNDSNGNLHSFQFKTISKNDLTNVKFFHSLFSFVVVVDNVVVVAVVVVVVAALLIRSD